MLLFEDGTQVGTLGGGCVEAEVKQKAARHFVEAAPRLHSFVLDHDYGWADGLICGGRMTILTESVEGAGVSYFSALCELCGNGGVTEMIAIDPERAGVPLGARRVIDQRTPGYQLVVAGAADWPESIPAPEPVESRPRPSVRGGVAYLPVPPRVRLVIVGAGHVGQAVAELASRVGFEIVVADDRSHYANDDRFPTAARLIVGTFDDVWRDLRSAVDRYSYILVVTRGHGHDQEALANLIHTPASYIGLIGSRRKIKLIFEALRELGTAESALARVAAPIGMDIGSGTVEEIAVSIVAELIAFRNLGTVPHSITARAEQR